MHSRKCKKPVTEVKEGWWKVGLCKTGDHNNSSHKLLEHVDQHTLIIYQYECMYVASKGAATSHCQSQFGLQTTVWSLLLAWAQPSLACSSWGIAPPGPHSSSTAAGKAAVTPYVQLELITQLFKNHFTSTLPPSPLLCLMELLCVTHLLSCGNKDTVIFSSISYIYYQTPLVLIIGLFAVGWWL